MALNDPHIDWEFVLQALNEKSEHAFTQLFVRHKEHTFIHILQLVKNNELAEDLTMETFTKAFKHLNQYQPTHSFSAWINTIAKNHSLDYLRKKRLESVSLDENSTNFQKANLENEDKDPEEELIAIELNNSVRALLNHLKDRYKRLIELRYLEELSYNEIAELLEQPVGTVKVQTHRAKELLLQIIKNKPDQL